MVATAVHRKNPGELLLNREIQLLAFNRRVLAQAEDRKIPTLERLRFLTIVSSNLDEFFEIRVAGLKEQIKLNAGGRGPDGKTPKEVFTLVAADAGCGKTTLIADFLRDP